jgi:hypothetical protein
VALGYGLIVALLFVIFEVGIRNVPPDGMTVTYDAPNPPTYTYAAPQDQGIINDYYSTLNTAPMESPFVHINGCSPIEYPQFVFTWHDIPVESWSGGCVYTESAGGVSDIFLLRFHLWNPGYGPLPPPAPR